MKSRETMIMNWELGDLPHMHSCLPAAGVWNPVSTWPSYPSFYAAAAASLSPAWAQAWGGSTVGHVQLIASWGWGTAAAVPGLL